MWVPKVARQPTRVIHSIYKMCIFPPQASLVLDEAPPARTSAGESGTRASPEGRRTRELGNRAWRGKSEDAVWSSGDDYEA